MIDVGNKTGCNKVSTFKLYLFCSYATNTLR